MDRSVRWVLAKGTGAEYLRISETSDGIAANSVVIGERNGVPFGLTYRLACDAAWCVRDVTVSIFGSSDPISIRSEGCGRWSDGHGRTLDELEGCLDVDIAATPFTNTLPIRRMGLAVGESREILVAYVAVPTMEVSAVKQRYTCLREQTLYRYESLTTGFACDLSVDEDGIVLDYPGVWRRV
jgi:uncharacterized protein